MVPAAFIASVRLMKGNGEPDNIFIKEDQSISVKNQENEVVKMDVGGRDCSNRVKKRKRNLKENESGGDFRKRRRNTLEDGQHEENMEIPKHVNVGNVDERQIGEASTVGENDDLKLGFEDGDEIQGSMYVNNESTSSKLKKNRNDANEVDLVRGIRFSKEEDEMVKKAVLDYVDEHQLGEDGVDMVMNSRKHRKLRNCWKDIAKTLPYRPQRSIRERAHNIFKRGNRGWTKEEINYIKEMHEKIGADWSSMAKKLGRYRIQVCDTYRRTKSPNFKKGHWSQDEYQALFDLVHADLEAKASVEMTKLFKRGMLRDNISWDAISDKLGTRYQFQCCGKWYYSLSSQMVVDGMWADTDDYRMLIALYNLDASCEEEVDWDTLMEHRAGELCRKRWKQMVRHIGEHDNKSFVEQVEVLSQRYCSKMLDIREKLDSRRAED